MSGFVRAHITAKRRAGLLTAAVCVAALAAVITAAVANAFGGGPSSRQASARTDRMIAAPTPDQLASVKSLADGLAQDNGGGKPSRIDVVATDRQAAELLDSGATVNSDEAVLMVSLPGRYVAKFASPPPGQASPTGSVLTFTYDPVAQQILDISVSQAEPNLSQLGQVSTISP